MGRKSRAKRERRCEREQQARIRTRDREDRRLAILRGAQQGRRRGCLLCRQSDGGFTSEEHIVPESLGNHKLVLPSGVVCDRCNNRCAQLDRELCEFSPVRFMRTASGVPSKKGRLPRFEFDNGSLWCDAPGEISVALDHDSSWRDDLPAPPGYRAFSFTAESSDVTPRRLAKVHRALVKQALELAWIDFGELALGPDFDREREIVLRGGHHGYIVIPKEVDPNAFGTEINYSSLKRASDGKPFVFVVAFLLGVPYVTDSLNAQPVNELPEDFNLLTF